MKHTYQATPTKEQLGALKQFMASDERKLLDRELRDFNSRRPKPHNSAFLYGASRPS